jgi:hypothetical protein
MIVEQSYLAANAYSNTGSHAHNSINCALPYMGTYFCTVLKIKDWCLADHTEPAGEVWSRPSA